VLPIVLSNDEDSETAGIPQKDLLGDPYQIKYNCLLFKGKSFPFRVEQRDEREKQIGSDTRWL
jgi:hypothetical protein